MNDVGSSADNNYSSVNGVNSGISVAANRSVNVLFSAQALPFDISTSGRYRYADLTITFNRAVTNPVLHFTGLGGQYGTLGFSGEFDLISTGVTLSKLNGSDALTVNATQVLNNASTITAATGTGGASGSVLVTTPSSGVTTLVFRVYLRGDGGGTTWHPQPGASNDTQHIGERWLIGVSSLTPAADVVTALTGPALASAGNRVIYTTTTTNNGPEAAPNVVPTLTLTPGLPAANVTLPAGASYDATSGVVTFAATASLASGASVSNTVVFTMPASGNVAGRVASTSNTLDNTPANNNGTAANANVTTVQTAPSCQPSFLDNSTASNGLTAEYYPTTFYQEVGFNENAITFFQRTSPQRRNDQTLNYTTNDSWPVTVFAAGTTTNPDNFSARYRGSINIPVTGSYTFYLTSDDASYMWLDGNALASVPNASNATINNGGAHSIQERSATVTLTAGLHDVLILYAEQGGDNNLRWEYASAAAGLARQVVPASVLCAGPAATNAPPVANNVTNATVAPNSTANALSPNLSGTDTDGSLAYYNIVTLPTSGTLSLNGVAVVAGQAISPAQLNQLTFTPTSGYTGNATFTYAATDNAGRTSQTVTYTIPVFSVISGTIFEDVNYGGGAGRTYAAANTSATASGFTSGAIRRPGATVELYNASGALVATTTTNATGAYTFNVAPATYTVRVVNSTVTSARPGSVAGLLPVQTLANAATDRVGGEAPEKQDAAANTGSQTLAALTSGTLTPQSITSITVPNAGTSNVDFGFNFDVVTNTNNAGQGSLRQFILNSNALTNANLAQSGQTAGKETSIFMIPTNSATTGLRAGLVSGLTNGVAVIRPTAELPTITDANTSIDGTTQTTNVGNTNTAVLGTGGTVGTDGLTLDRVNGPEVQLVGTRAFNGLTTSATNAAFRGLSIYGFVSGISVAANAANVLIEQNVIGTSATSFTDPGNARTTEQGVALNSSDNGIIRNNLIAFNGGMGIWALGNNNDGSNNNSITNNEIRGNAQEVIIDPEGLVFDGLELQGLSTGNTVSGNLITANLGHGIDSFGNAIGGNTISGNTISNNGQGVAQGTGAEGSGLRVYGANNATTISKNVLTGNNGSGVLVMSTARQVNISQNSMSGNTRLGIDLLSTTEANTAANTYNGLTGTTTNVTLNDDGDGDTGGNGLTNMPVITTATIRNGNLLLTGFSRPGATLEFFIANVGTSTGVGNTNFGQGQTYLFTRTEGTNDLDATTDNYSGNINGFNQGAETGQNRFSYSVPLSSLTAAQQTALTANGVRLTATATQVALVNGNQGTSEFSGNAPLINAPVAVNDFATTTPGTAVTLTVTNNDQNSIDPATVALSGQVAGSTTSVTVTGGTFQFLSNGQVRFTPAAGFTGIATVPYTVNNTSGVPSNTAYISVEVKGTTFNLATTVTGPASVNAGATATYSVVSSNPGSVAATGVTETVQLPAGLATTGFTVGGSTGTLSNGVITFPTGSYNQNTGLLTLNIGNLAANTGSVTTAVAFPAPGSNPLTVTASISGNGGTETTTTDNTALVTTTVVPRYDATTAITGPASVTAGNEVTYTVVTRNVATGTNPNSVSPAANVEQTVTLPGNITGIYASNGGTVSFSSTNNTTTVTFPVIDLLMPGQTQVNTISFVAPTSSFAAPIATVTSGPSGNNANDLNSPTVGTNNNTAQLNGAAAGSTVTVTAGTGPATNVYTSISATNTNVAPGGNIDLTIVASNAGPVAAAGVQQTVSLPTGLTFTTLGGGTYNPNTGVLTFPALTSSLAVGASQTYTVAFNAPQQGTVLATATVTTTSPELTASDNVAQTRVTVTPLADVATTLAGPTSALPGQLLTYTVTTANNGQAPASNVVERVQLPAGLTDVMLNNVTASSTVYNATTGILTISYVDALSMGFSQTNTITFSAPSSMASFSAVASVSTSTSETAIANNTATVTTTVTPAADVIVSATAPASAVVGNQVLYVVSTTNNGAAAATGVVPTLQLPAGLGATNVTFPAGSGTGTYDNTTGLVTFPTMSTLPSGSSIANEVAVVMPDVAQLNGVARVTTTSYDTNLDNNYASVATTPAAATATTADLRVVSFTPATATVNAGANTTLTATFSNAGTGTATNVVPQIVLIPGLSNVSAGAGTYNGTTGIVTFPAVTSVASGATVPGTYSVSFAAPASGPVNAVASVTSATSDGVLANNTALATVNVTSQANATTSVSGPVSAAPGSKVTYAVTTSNLGTSPATTVVQTVTVPNTVTDLTFPAGSTTTVSGSNIVITFPTVASLAAGSVNAVTNYVSFTTPATATSVTVAGAVTSSIDTNPNNNSASVTTIANRAPVAYNVVNSLQSPEGNTATSALFISPLAAADADGNTTLTYRVTELPAAATGTLYLADGVTPVTTATVLTATQASQLRFLPATGFVGNAIFSYTAVDNATVPATSNVAQYTIQVGSDVNSAYAATPTKGIGGSGPYQNGDVLTYIIDTNGARYVTPATGGSALVYNATTGALLAGASNGLASTGTNAVVAGSSSLTAAQLDALGIGLNPATGQLFVADRTKLRSGTYSVSITTTDVNGGTNTVVETFGIGVNPLPVELVAFSVQRVQQNAVLSWSTASEKNNAYFVVERSFDGSAFTAVGRVAGQGSTSQAHVYGLVDAKVPHTGTVYYRLRQVDQDGTESLSPVRTVVFTGEVVAQAPTLYPNPTTTRTTLDLRGLAAGSYQVSVVDMAGRTVASYSVSGGLESSLDVQQLPVGTYVVLVQGTNGRHVLRLVKQ
ncbi:right-handed parallel beta-helix repeat-containing protein [Hymenobacter aerilatus]|uniref:Right-handed parallel beta-helix repeat-containing protein n=2 Tax=Hymenobacter aerilatus TaxID=2932251 RepID=A0A8T9T3D5_9BACT|nr:right-handed parallel beta-helix repeat-containing protein [Hymenobacter aerilatus]